MTVSAEFKFINLERSFYRFFHEQVENSLLPPVTVEGASKPRVGYDDTYFDTEGLDRWVLIDFIDYGIGVNADALLQIKLVTRMYDDPQKMRLKELLDQVREKLNINDIQMYNFSSPVSPSMIYYKGDPDQPLKAALRLDGNAYLPEDEGLAGMVLTYSLHAWRDDVVQ